MIGREWGEGIEWMGEGVRMSRSVEPERIDQGERGERVNGLGEAGGERVNGWGRAGGELRVNGCE
jgi:hypothetical protein